MFPHSTDHSYQGNFTKHRVWNEVAINMSVYTYKGHHYHHQLQGFHLCGYVEQERIKSRIISIV